MSSPAQPAAERQASLAEPNLDRVAQVDRSLRASVTGLAVASVLWLALGSLLALVAALKLHLPDFLNTETLTFGRVRALQQVAIGYGWSFNAALAAALWIMHRLGRVEFRHGWVALLGAFGWNAALLHGSAAIAAGRLTGADWLQFPAEVVPVLVASFLLVGLWSAVAFSRRQTGHTYVSQWYILAATFWLPVLCLGALLALRCHPARGTVQSVVDGWYAHGVTSLFLSSVGLASLYYFLPKVLGRPIHSYYLATVGFWTFALFSSWAGLAHLVGAPIPVWLQSTSIVAAAMMAIPVLVIAINLVGTVARGGAASPAGGEPTLRFSTFAAASFALAGLVAAVSSLRSVSAVTRFTDFTLGQEQLLLQGFLAMAMFGALYYILPRLARREWPSASLVRAHFWLCALGVVGLVAVLCVHGWIQGHQWNDPAVSPVQVAASAQPWNVAGTVFTASITLGHLVFAAHVLWLLAPRAERRDGQPLVAR